MVRIVEWLRTQHLETNHLVPYLGSSNYKLCDLGQVIHLALGQDTKDDIKIVSYKDSMRMIINSLMGSLKRNSKTRALGPVSDKFKVIKLVIIIQWQQ